MIFIGRLDSLDAQWRHRVEVDHGLEVFESLPERCGQDANTRGPGVHDHGRALQCLPDAFLAAGVERNELSAGGIMKSIGEGPGPARVARADAHRCAQAAEQASHPLPDGTGRRQNDGSSPMQ